MLFVQVASRQTGTRSTHIVSTGFGFSEVSSCTHSSGPAKPYFAPIARPFWLPLLDFHPSSLRTFSGEPHVQASARPIATIFASLPTLASRCCCTSPYPHPFIGSVGSVQLVLSLKCETCPVIAGSPFPDWMLYQATLKVAGADCADAGAGT